MAIIKIENVDYTENDWQDETISKNVLKRGFVSIDITNKENTSAPEILAESAVDVNGVIYKFDSNTAITDPGVSNGDVFVTVTGGSSPSVQYTNTEPTYNWLLNGFYVGTDRAIMRLKKEGTEYTEKFLLSYLMDNWSDQDLWGEKTFKEDLAVDGRLLLNSGDYQYNVSLIPEFGSDNLAGEKWSINTGVFLSDYYAGFESYQTVNPVGFTSLVFNPDETKIYSIASFYYETGVAGRKVIVIEIDVEDGSVTRLFEELWPATGEDAKLLTPYMTPITSDGTTIYCGYAEPDGFDWDAGIIPFDLNTNTFGTPMLGVSDGVGVDYMALSPDESTMFLFASTGSNRYIKALNLSTGVVDYTSATLSKNVSCIAVSPDGNDVYVGVEQDHVADTSYVYKLDATDLSTVWTYNGLYIDGERCTSEALEVTPDSSAVYIASEGYNSTYDKAKPRVTKLSSDKTVFWNVLFPDSNDNVDYEPFAIKSSPDGTKLYVVNSNVESYIDYYGLSEMDASNGTRGWLSQNTDLNQNGYGGSDYGSILVKSDGTSLFYHWRGDRAGYDHTYVCFIRVDYGDAREINISKI